MTKQFPTEEALDAACIFDDIFATTVFDHDPKNTETVLKAVLNKPELTLRHVETEKYIKNMQGHSARFDVFADDTDDVLYVVEVQRISTRCTDGRQTKRFSASDLIKRATHDLYMLGLMATEANEPYGKQREHYVIYLMDEDLFGVNLSAFEMPSFPPL